MFASADPHPTDAAELQNLLTRYIDSHEGYHQVADVLEPSSHASAFREIADRRKVIAEHMSQLIVREGDKPDTESSPEAAIHRWWISIRAKMTEEELEAALEECIRGEKELARVAESVAKHGNLKPEHASVVAELATDVNETIRTFETALGR
jgi:uncharacterized protein (TIGR02284 family)